MIESLIFSEISVVYTQTQDLMILYHHSNCSSKIYNWK